MNNGQRLVLFDFDGTLTRKDTLFEIAKYVHGLRRFYVGMIELSYYCFLYKVGLAPNWKTKERILSHFFGGVTYDFFQRQCNRFVEDKLLSLLRKDAMEKLMTLKQNGAEIVIVSASAENWIKPWCDRLGIACIATKLEVENKKLTGKIAGKNCYGEEKVKRIKQEVRLSRYNAIYAYGDSKGDLPMLRLATHSYYRAFHE